MTEPLYVRSGPANSRALWHMVNPLSPDKLTWCSRHASGPQALDRRMVEQSPWDECSGCRDRRTAAISNAVDTLRAVAPGLLVEGMRESDRMETP